MGEYDDVREFLRETKQEAIEKKRAEARREHRCRMRGVNKSMDEAEDIIFRSLRWSVNNFGPKGASSGRRRF